MPAITSFPPLFGNHRKVDLPPIEVVEITAADGTALRLHQSARPSVLLTSEILASRDDFHVMPQRG